MNIALIAHNNKKELMEAFCIAYKFILEKHNILAPGSTGSSIREATGIPVTLLDFGELGEAQLAARISYNEMDLVIYFADGLESDEELRYLNEIRRYSDQNNIPFATNIATAEILVNGLHRGDFAWRELVRADSSL